MYGIYESPIGKILIRSNDGFITEIDFLDNDTNVEVTENDDLINKCIDELKKYFIGQLKEFTVPIKFNSTQFRNSVYKELLKIPYGETICYSELANRINNSKAVRAVGQANHNNKIIIIVPCHRVIGKNGNLTGFGGGLWRKKWLLENESRSSMELL